MSYRDMLENRIGKHIKEIRAAIYPLADRKLGI